MKIKKSINCILLLAFVVLPKQAICEEIRVVSLAPVATEIIYALKAQDKLVGVTDICKLEDGRQLKRLGAYSAVSPEAVFNLKPTLVVVTEGAENQADMLRKVGLKIFEVKTSSLENVKKSIFELAKELGLEKNGEAAVLVRENKLNDVVRLKDDHKSKILILFGDEGSHLGAPSFYGIGQATFYDDLVRKLGLENVLKQNGYNILSLEGVCSIMPSCILISTDGGNEKDIEAIQSCHKDVKIKAVPKDPFLYPGIKYPEIATSIAGCVPS